MVVTKKIGGTGASCAGAVFLIVGLGALGGGAYWAQSTQRFIAGASHADGRVIRMESHHSSDGTTYSPTVQFVTKEGKEITFTSSTSSNPPSHHEGDMVRVMYDPAGPESAKIDSFVDLWLGPILVGGVFGVIFTLVGVAALLQGLRGTVQQRRLRENGLRIAAEVQGVEGANGMYTIVARATDTRGIQRIFRSAPMTTDPGQKMLGRSSVEVLVDPDDYGTYEVDLAFLKG